MAPILALLAKRWALETEADSERAQIAHRRPFERCEV